jgi:uncharacterized OB-fold protein
MKTTPEILGGTPLESTEIESAKVFAQSYVPQLRYAWDTGEAIGRYLQELKQGRLIARRCDHCARVMIPPRMFCERCFRPTDDWVYLKDTGKIITFSLCYVSWDVRRLKRPQIPAVIEIDGASPGMGILHVVKKVPPKQVKVGMPVRAVWKPSRKRIGGITDIDYWEPAAKMEERQ